MVQSYLPGGVNVHPPSSTPQLASTPYQCCPMLSWLLDTSGHVLGRPLFTLNIAPSHVVIWTPI